MLCLKLGRVGTNIGFAYGSLSFSKQNIHLSVRNIITWPASLQGVPVAGPMTLPKCSYIYELKKIVDAPRMKFTSFANTIARDNANFIILGRTFLKDNSLLLAKFKGSRYDTKQQTFASRGYNTLSRSINRLDKYLCGKSGDGQGFKNNGSRLIYIIVSINILVFILWQYAQLMSDRNPELLEFMFKYFTVGDLDSIRRENSWASIILSNISHMHTMHIFFNLIATVSFADSVLYHLGSARRFIAFYLISCVCTAAASIAFKEARKRNGYVAKRSLGASGTVMGMLTIFALINPTAHVTFLGLISLPSYIFVSAIILVSMWQSVGVNSYSGSIDVAGHLGGAIGGLITWAAFRGRTTGHENLIKMVQDDLIGRRKKRIRLLRWFIDRNDSKYTMYPPKRRRYKCVSTNLSFSTINCPLTSDFRLDLSKNYTLANLILMRKKISQINAFT